MGPCNPSIQSRKRKGKKGSPYLMPLDGWILPVGSPWINMEYDTKVTQHDELDPLISKPHCLHYCFKIWSFHPIICLTRVKLDCHKVILPNMFLHAMERSKSTKILSNISLLLVKVLWFSVIIFGRILFNLFPRTFKKILYRTLQRLMGRNSKANSRFFFFGIRVIKVWFFYL